MKFTRLFPLLLCLTLFGCHKEDEYRSDTTGAPVQALFAGRITDEQGIALAGATVSAGTSETTTDANGVFRLPAATLPARNAILKVKKAGYFDWVRAYSVSDGVLLPVNIQLLSRQLVQSFPSGQAAEIGVDQALIRFDANSVQFANGTGYDGVVQVYARYLDPGDPGLGRYMPGDLRGTDTQGETRTLATFGMIGVELSTPGGDPLQLAPGHPAEISVPIPSAKLSAAPADIPLWYFDTEQARWIEEGRAQKSGNRYVGKVQHFTFWNCDGSFPLVHLSGKVLMPDGQTPLAGAWLRLTISSSGYSSYGYADSQGNFGGGVPRDEAMLLEVFSYDQCGDQALYTQTVGPFTEDAVLPAITVQAQDVQPIHVSGRLVDCNQQALPNAYVLVGNGDNLRILFADGAGNFQGDALWCAANGALTLTGYNPDTQLLGDVLSIPNPVSPVQAGDLSICQSTTEQVFITLIGSFSYTFTGPFSTSYDDSFHTSISASNGATSLSFVFSGFGQAGTYNVLNFSISKNGIPFVSAHSGTTAVTQYGAFGEMITGTFNGTVYDESGTAFPAMMSYQVIRDF